MKTTKTSRRGLFFSMPAYGHINPSLALVKGLCEAGEKISYFTTEEFFPVVEKTGAQCEAYVNIPQRKEIPSDITDNYFHFAKRLVEMSEEALGDLIPRAKALKPDFILHDSVAFWGWCVAKHLGVPAISTIPTFAIGTSGAKKDKRYFSQVLPMAVFSIHSVLALLYKSYRLSRRYQIPFAGLETVLCATQNRNIVYTTFDLQIEGKGFDAFTFVGPSLREEKDPDPFDAGKNGLFISLGTFNNEKEQFFLDCFEAFKDYSGDVLVALGDLMDPKSLGSTPENFDVRVFFPQLHVLKKVKVFISHSGMNSVHESLFNAVPLVLVPQTPEQEVVAEQVEKAGAGIWLRKSQRSPSHLRHAVARVLSEPSFKTNAERISAGFKQAGGSKKAVQVVLEYLASCQKA